MGKNKKNKLENNTKDNPYDNYHGHQNNRDQNLEDAVDVTGKDYKNKKHKNK